jgi:HK97 family phage major capsid protein
MKYCMHCGKELTEKSVDTCEHCKAALVKAPVKQADPEIAAIKQVVTDGVAPLKDEIKGAAEKMSSIEERLAKIEKMPMNRPFFISNVPTVYKGYKLSEQGEKLRNRFAGNKSFKCFSNDEKFENYAKFMIDGIKALRGDIHAKMAMLEKTENVEGTDSVGGYLVPVEAQSDIIKLARDVSFALNSCTTIPMREKQQTYPAEASLVTSYWVDEVGSITTSNPTYGQVTLTAKKLAGLTDYISNELLADADYDLVGALTEMFAYAKGLELDNQVLNGTGSQCSGVLTALSGSYSVIMSSSNFSTISADDLSLMISKLSEADVAGAKFIYNRLIQHYIRTLKDTNNQYIWQRPGEGRPGTIWEVPYLQSVKAPSTSGASTAFVVLGNFKNFFIGIRKNDMVLDVDPYGGFATDKTRFRMVGRYGLSVARASAFCRLITSS